ncbi:hypothetical protein BHE74_00005741 [Ensete ventricosum]|nr:hypothetical protein BHE74_00005741 [Ensete ventricosum]
MCFASVSVEQALLVQARVRYLARGRLDEELELGDREEPRGSAREVDCWGGGARSLYSGCCRSSVPGDMAALVAYHAVAHFHHAVLAVGHVSTVEGVGLTCVRSAVRPLAPPYLRPASFPRRVGHVDGPIVRGRTDVATGSPSVVSDIIKGREPVRHPLGPMKRHGEKGESEMTSWCKKNMQEGPLSRRYDPNCPSCVRLKNRAERYPLASLLHAGVDEITVTWALNQSLPAGTDSGYKKVKVTLCYAPVSQTDRGWRKTDDHLKKDKTCQFKMATRPYAATGTVTYTVERIIPTATFFVRAYVLDSDDTEVAYGQTTDPKKTTNLFDIVGVTGRHASLDIAAACFSAFSVVALAFFFVVEKKKAKK